MRFFANAQNDIMKFGFHISISGGFSKVAGRAKAKGCETIQVFSRNPRGWNYTPLDPNKVRQFKEDTKISKISPVIVHMPYLPNLGSIKQDLWERSIVSLKEELKRAETLGASFVVMHVGSRGEVDKKVAIERVITGINKALNSVKNSVILLLENTAGQGSEMGYRFEEMRKIIDGVSDSSHIGVCLDTAHAFEAGYDLKSRLDAVIDEFDKIIGIERLKVLHLNDSKTPLGSHKDRHWHIGEGEIGLDAFRNIVNHPLLKDLPGIMETPCKTDEDDLRNMRVIKKI